MQGRLEGSCRVPFSVGEGIAHVSFLVEGLPNVSVTPLILQESVQEMGVSTALIWYGGPALGVLVALALARLVVRRRRSLTRKRTAAAPVERN